jgi:hypothetical protein
MSQKANTDIYIFTLSSIEYNLFRWKIMNVLSSTAFAIFGILAFPLQRLNNPSYSIIFLVEPKALQ